jgi:hypothetical protein
MPIVYSSTQNDLEKYLILIITENIINIID